MVVNGVYIYTLVKGKPVVIDIPAIPSKLVVTDGFHITDPLELSYAQARTSYFQVACAIENDQLLVMLVLAVFFFALGAATGALFIQALGVAPIVYLLFLYYINRKEFIQIKPALIG